MISEKEGLDVREPPGKAMGKIAELWKPVEGTNKIMCTACARYCKIGEGQVGLCGIRGVHEGKLWMPRSEEHTSELQSRSDLVCRLLLEKKNACPRCGSFAGRPQNASRPDPARPPAAFRCNR